MKQMTFIMTDNQLQVDRGLLTCEYCGAVYEPDDVDQTEEGFWCEPCGSDQVEYFNYFDPVKRPRFLLFLEQKAEVNDPYQRRDSLKLNKRLSPLRYPGGKSKVAEHLAAAMRPEQLHTLVSVYAGGASVELAMLQAGLIEELILNDLDFGIFSLFYMIKQQPQDLIQRIREHTPRMTTFSCIATSSKVVIVVQTSWTQLGQHY